MPDTFDSFDADAGDDIFVPVFPLSPLKLQLLADCALFLRVRAELSSLQVS